MCDFNVADTLLPTHKINPCQAHTIECRESAHVIYAVSMLHRHAATQNGDIVNTTLYQEGYIQTTSQVLQVDKRGPKFGDVERNFLADSAISRQAAAQVY